MVVQGLLDDDSEQEVAARDSMAIKHLRPRNKSGDRIYQFPYKSEGRIAGSQGNNALETPEQVRGQNLSVPA